MNPVAGGSLPSHTLKEEYVYDGESASPVAALAGLAGQADSLDVNATKNYRGLRDRYRCSHESMKRYLQHPPKPRFIDSQQQPLPLSEAGKRALELKAQAVAHSSDHPGWVIANRYDVLLTKLAQSPELSKQCGIKKRLIERIKRSHTLPVNDPGNWKKVHRGVRVLALVVNQKVHENRISLDDIPVYPRHFPETFDVEPAYLKKTLNARYARDRMAEVGTTGLVYCDEVSSHAIGRHFERAHQVGFVPTVCFLTFDQLTEKVSSFRSEMSKLVLSNHVFIVFMALEHYRAASHQNMFEENQYTLLPEDNEEAGKVSGMPLLFKQYTCAVSDPWLHQWGLVDNKTWPAMLRGCLRECTGFLEGKKRRQLLSDDLRYKVEFKQLY